MAVPAVSSWPKSMSGSSLQPWNTRMPPVRRPMELKKTSWSRDTSGRDARAWYEGRSRGDHDARAEDRARAEVDVHQRAHGDGRAEENRARLPGPEADAARRGLTSCRRRVAREEARARARAEDGASRASGANAHPASEAMATRRRGAPRIMREKKGTSPLFRGVGVAAESFNRTRNRPSCRRIYVYRAFFFRFQVSVASFIVARLTPHSSSRRDGDDDGLTATLGVRGRRRWRAEARNVPGLRGRRWWRTRWRSCDTRRWPPRPSTRTRVPGEEGPERARDRGGVPARVARQKGGRGGRGGREDARERRVRTDERENRRETALDPGGGACGRRGGGRVVGVQDVPPETRFAGVERAAAAAAAASVGRRERRRAHGRGAGAGGGRRGGGEARRRGRARARAAAARALDARRRRRRRSPRTTCPPRWRRRSATCGASSSLWWRGRCGTRRAKARTSTVARSARWPRPRASRPSASLRTPPPRACAASSPPSRRCARAPRWSPPTRASKVRETTDAAHARGRGRLFGRRVWLGNRRGRARRRVPLGSRRRRASERRQVARPALAGSSRAARAAGPSTPTRGAFGAPYSGNSGTRGGDEYRPRVVDASPPSTPADPPHPASYRDVLDMLDKGLTPPGIKDVDDKPPDPTRSMRARASSPGESRGKRCERTMTRSMRKKNAVPDGPSPRATTKTRRTSPRLAKTKTPPAGGARRACPRCPPRRATFCSGRKSARR